jgi:hypothetical protein
MAGRFGAPPDVRAPSSVPVDQVAIEPRPVPAAAIPPTLVLGYLDLSIRGTLEYERYENLYLSPWWEMTDVPDGVSAWKRAVLERIPLRGAAHWGHMYLIVSDSRAAGSRFSIGRRSSAPAAPRKRPDETRLALREGRQLAELILRASRRDHAAGLAAFGREIELRFRRQMD